MPLSVISGLTAIAQFMVFWHQRSKPHHSTLKPFTVACSYRMSGTSTENLYERASTQPPPLIEPSVPSSSATHTAVVTPPMQFQTLQGFCEQ